MLEVVAVAAAQDLGGEQPHEPAVELRAGDVAQLVLGLVGGHLDPVGVGRGEHVVDLGHGEDARRHRDAVAGEPVRVALAVDPLVVGEHGRGHLAHPLDAQQQARAVGGVALDQPQLGRMELAAADQDVIGQRLLAQVVQQAGGVDDRLLALGQPGRAGELVRVVGDRGGVAGGLGSRSASVSSSRPSMPSWRTSSWFVRRSISSECAWPSSSARSSSW